MINIIDLIELKLQLMQNGYGNLSSNLVNAIINNDAFDNSPKGLNVYYLVEQLTSSNYPYNFNNVAQLEEDVDTFISTYFDFLTENEQELFYNLIMSKFLFVQYQSFNDILFMSYISRIETILSSFINYSNLDGIYIAKEELKVWLVRLYDILMNTGYFESYVDKESTLIQDIRLNATNRQAVQDLIDKLGVNV